MLFKDFDLNPKLLQGIEALGFVEPTDIQKKAIPYLMNETKDLIALAQTGTGKTASFGLPVLSQIDFKLKHVQVIVLCPTRELCMQLAADLESYSKFIPEAHILSVYGGTDISRQIKALKRGPQVIVGTPGRTLDLIRRKKLLLDNIEYVVFDEADEMLSMGFKDDMDAILEVTPEEKRVLLFSATMPKEIAAMTKHYMNNPYEIAIGAKNIGNKNVEHHVYMVQGRRKYEVLKRIADINPNIYGIIFCRTRAETKDIAARLGQDGYNADAIHGDLSQSQRDIVMDRFRSKQLQLLVATDVAARGIDVSDLTHVINFNIPDDLSIYVHRSGRTGRANNKGLSLILCTGRDKNRIRQLEKKIKLPVIPQLIPSGTEVCQSQLMHKIDRIENAEVDMSNLEAFLPEIYERLSKFSNEELIQKIVALELNDLLKYYKNATDLNVKESKRKDRKQDRSGGREPSSMEYSRFYINLGQKHHINPKTLLSVINKYTPEHSVEVGAIEIMKGFSFFEVDAALAHIIPDALNKAKFDNTPIVVKPVAAADRSSGRGRSGGRGRSRSGSGGRGRGRSGGRSDRGRKRGKGKKSWKK